jgi:alpha-D-xyloside xylohydrolase
MSLASDNPNPLGPVSSFNATASPTDPTLAALTATFASGHMTASFWSPRAARVTFGESGATPSCPLPSLQPAPGVFGGLAAAHDDSTARLFCRHDDYLRLRFHRDGGVLDALSPDGAILVSVAPSPANPGHFRLRFTLRPGEDLYGLGLQLSSLRQRGHARFLKINADPRDDSGNAHVVVPLLLSTRGYGVLVNTHEYTWWDLGCDDPASWWVEVSGRAAEVFLLAGTLRDQVRAYLALTGRPALPPKWGLGFWYRPKSGWDEAKVKSVVEDFRAQNLPIQVLGLEPSWQTHSYPCSYMWNTDQWPDPAAFVKWCTDRGVRLNLWEHAYVHEASPIHKPLLDEHLAADKTVWGGLVPDFTLPRAREIFLGLHEKEHISLGVSGYKLDECDGSDFTDGWSLPDDARLPSGLTGAQYHNVLGYLYSRTMHEAFEGRGRRSYFLCRANYAGGQADATCNYSDLYGFREYVRLLPNAGFACTPWCPEVRDVVEPIDYVRRSQVVFLSWLAMINAWASGSTPWDCGPEAEAAFREAAGLRQSLLPYIYASWEAQARTGLGLTRALVVDFQDDPASRAIDDEYLFGRWMLVAPLPSGDERDVYLPPGQWRDWWTGEVHDGGRTIRTHVPLAHIPLFLREGAIVPMLTGGADAFSRWTSLRLVCWPAAAASDYELYDDDGESTAYLEGQSWRWPVKVQRTADHILLALGYPGGELKPWLERVTWEVLGVDAAPAQVLLNGHAVPQLDERSLTGTADGWTWAHGVLRISLRPMNESTLIARLH